MKAFIISIIFIAVTFQAHSAEKDKNSSWTFTRGDVDSPRGGTTKGPKVEYETTVQIPWKRLKAPDITKHERDRRAIYAMTGTYQSQFEFIETILMDTVKPMDLPYATWGTEFVKVIEDRGDFISLQHIMVMYFLKDEEINGPHVVKHWRQDWQWEGKDQLLYHGDNTWSIEKVLTSKTRGKWVWTVYQVDDSPRYSGIGAWDHFKSTSVFETGYMSRPLPRREFSVRSDYKLLMGKDALLITPEGWYHEQRNFKHKGHLKDNQFNGTFLAREIGHNSYRRIKNFDITAGEEYWKSSQNYWKDVRDIWNQIFQNQQKFTLKGKVDGMPLYTHHFSQSEDPKVLNMSSQERKDLIKKTIGMYLK